ncbi:ROK family transcriptional regulator [Vallitalea maricola]|uniref:ROK family protein n=1 Tax=Vallitalea maricola TaxID=3074433 RepID=A0ACB5UIB3_9FIRM|nr:ROK family protein [Vallitalea sp. AN17-2]
MEKYSGKPKLIKKVNQSLIKNVISQQGPISKPEISKICNLSLPTVNKTVDILVNKGVVKKSQKDIKVEGSGKRPIFYEINSENAYIIALYIEDRKVEGCLVDATGGIRLQKELYKMQNVNLDRKNDFYNYILELIEGVEDKELIKAIAVGMPGVVDEEGIVTETPNIPEWEGINIKSEIEKFFNINAYIENDANLTAIGIYYENYKEDYNDLIYMYLGEGIGAGIIIDGKLHKGKSGFAGEISYMITEHKMEDQKETLYKGCFEKEWFAIYTNSTLNEKERKRLLLNKVTYALVNAISLLNTEIVVIRSPYFESKDLKLLENNVCNYIGEKNCPLIKYIDDLNIGLKGAIRLGLLNLESQIHLIL